MKNAPVYRTEGIGEDWEGLKSMVSGSTLVNRDEILFIIGHNERDTEREEAIRALMTAGAIASSSKSSTRDCGARLSVSVLT